VTPQIKKDPYIPSPCKGEGEGEVVKIKEILLSLSPHPDLLSAGEKEICRIPTVAPRIATALYLHPEARMPERDFEYDVFLSHASEDTAWCRTLAERLRNEGARVWFDEWELKPGDHLLARLNEGMGNSRTTIAV
jgi:hypothetical protein